MNPPIASPFGDGPQIAPEGVPPHLHWNAQLGCFALRYRTPIRAKFRCLPKELRRSPLHILWLFLMAPMWFIWTVGLNLPLALHAVLALLLSPLGILTILLIQWKIKDTPGLVMIGRDAIIDQFPGKTTTFGWSQFRRVFEDDGDLFFQVTATKGLYFTREAFADAQERELFFHLVESLIKSEGAAWDALAAEFAPQLTPASQAP